MFNSRKLQAIKNIQKLDEFGGSLRQALKAAGYSDAIANNPKRITDRKWFSDSLPDYQKTAQAIHNLMDSCKLTQYTFVSVMSDQDVIEFIEGVPGCKVLEIIHSKNKTKVYYLKPDNNSIVKAIYIVLKIRGYFAPDKTQIVEEFENMSEEEILQEIDELRIIIKARQSIANKQKVPQ